MRHRAAVIYELITALQLPTKPLYVFTYLSVSQHLTVILFATLLDCGGSSNTAELPSTAFQPSTILKPPTKSFLPRAVMLHSILPHTTLMHHWVPLLGRRFLIGRRCCLRRFLQVRDVGKVVLLGHTDGQSQDHHLPFAGSRGDKQRKTGQTWGERQRRPAGRDERGESDMEVGMAQRGQRRRGVISGADRKHKRPF